MAKANNAKRCMQCSLQERLCICALVPRIEARTQLVLLIHQREQRKFTNTGTLAARSLVKSEVHVIGARAARLDQARVFASDALNLLLFPTQDAVPLDPACAASFGGPVRLIVPDGHWGQAAKIRRRVAKDAAVTCVTLPEGPASQYGLRRPARDVPGGLSTLEAIARALEVLEGPAVSAPLLEIFRIFVARTLWSRGKISAEDVYGRLPALKSAFSPE